MTVDRVLDGLPLMPESRLGADQLPGTGWWAEGCPQSLLPLVARPQLKQELDELFAYARSERLGLIAVGTATSQFRLKPAPDCKAYLCVQPGHTEAWAGPDSHNRTAWMPAGLDVADAEAKLNEHGLSLTPWHVDHGSLGGNWVDPRGSFAVRDFLDPAARRLGVEVLLPHGEWMRTREAPRTAAGPHAGKMIAGTQGAGGLLTSVRLAVEPLGDCVEGWAEGEDPEDAFGGLRELLLADMRPSALWLHVSGGTWRLIWRQNCWNGWGRHTWDAARARFGLDTDTAAPAVERGDAWGKFRPWSRLLPWTESGTTATFCGPTPEGMVQLGPATAPPAGVWGAGLRAASAATILPVP